MWTHWPFYRGSRSVEGELFRYRPQRQASWETIPKRLVVCSVHRALLENFTYRESILGSRVVINSIVVSVLRVRIRRIRMFLGLPDTDPLVQVRIRILLSSSKNSKKNLDFYCFGDFFTWLFIFEKNDVKCSFKKVSKKTIKKFSCHLEIHWRNSRIRIR